MLPRPSSRLAGGGSTARVDIPPDLRRFVPDGIADLDEFQFSALPAPTAQGRNFESELTSGLAFIHQGKVGAKDLTSASL